MNCACAGRNERRFRSSPFRRSGTGSRQGQAGKGERCRGAPMKGHCESPALVRRTWRLASGTRNLKAWQPPPLFSTRRRRDAPSASRPSVQALMPALLGKRVYDVKNEHGRNAMAATKGREQEPQDRGARTAPRRRKSSATKFTRKNLHACTPNWSSCSSGSSPKGSRSCVVFEGRDGAGKGGVIKAITERVSPRVFRVVALPAPDRPGKVADVYSAIHAAFSGRRRDRHLRPQLVQSRRRRTRDGILLDGAGRSAFSKSRRSSRRRSSNPASSSSNTGSR